MIGQLKDSLSNIREVNQQRAQQAKQFRSPIQVQIGQKTIDVKMFVFGTKGDIPQHQLDQGTTKSAIRSDSCFLCSNENKKMSLGDLGKCKKIFFENVNAKPGIYENNIEGFQNEFKYVAQYADSLHAGINISKQIRGLLKIAYPKTFSQIQQLEREIMKKGSNIDTFATNRTYRYESPSCTKRKTKKKSQLTWFLDGLGQSFKIPFW